MYLVGVQGLEVWGLGFWGLGFLGSGFEVEMYLNL